MAPTPLAVWLKIWRLVPQSLLAGMLMAVSSYPWRISPGVFWVLGLLLWWRWIEAQTQAKRAVLGTFSMAMVAHLGFTLWLWQLPPLDWTGISVWLSLPMIAAAWLLWAGLYALVWGVWGGVVVWSAQVLKPYGAVMQWLGRITLAMTLPWGFEILQAITDLYVPWVEPVHTFVDLMPVHLGLKVLGLNGLHALLIGFGGALIAMGSLGGDKRQQWLTRLGFVALLWMGGTLWVNIDKSAAKLEALPPLAILQRNVPIDTVRNPTTQLYSPYMAALMRQSFPNGTWIVLPEEGMIRGLVSLEHPMINRDLKALQHLANTRGWSIITGLSSRNAQNHLYNTLMILAPQTTPQVYHKHQLVPFGETVPNVLTPLAGSPVEGWLGRLLHQLRFGYVPSFSAGQPVQQQLSTWFAGENTPQLLPTICFEGAMLPPHHYQPAWMVNVSNLGWFHGSKQLSWQFLQKARLLAAQQQAPLVISANTGPSAIISATGEIMAQLPPDTVGLLAWPEQVLDFEATNSPE